MHPTSALIIWIYGILSAQIFSYDGLLILFVLIFATSPGAFKPFLRLARRSRWLFLSLWLIFAYGKAGEALAGVFWMPTLEGIAEANLQLSRLLAILACLAWLLARLGREGLVSALWGMLSPLKWLGLEVERLAVRLTLVLDHLQTPLAPGAWKHLLRQENVPGEDKQIITLSMPAWSFMDLMCVISPPLIFLWIVLQ